MENFWLFFYQNKNKNIIEEYVHIPELSDSLPLKKAKRSFANIYTDVDAYITKDSLESTVS